MKKIIIITLLLISTASVAQVGVPHTPMSITTSPNNEWIAVGQGAFGHPYEITVAANKVRDDHYTNGSTLYRFRLNSMFHNEYFDFAKNASGKVVRTKTGFMLGESEMNDLNLTSEVSIAYDIKHPIFNYNDSLAQNFGTIDYLFNPRITSINFYDDKTLIIYNTLGIFALKLNMIENGKFVHKLSLLKMSEFTEVGDLDTYYVYKKHNNGSLTVEKKKIIGPDHVESDGTETIILK